MEHPTFTVFTPTFNRAGTLPRVFESLQAQTFRDFEWLVVDDGSTDETRQVIEGFRRDASFPIRYVRQDVNAGKHVAFNRGVREAAGDLFLTLDSDDACVPEALARFKHHWDAIPDDRRAEFSAVTALCMDERGRVVGDRFPTDPLDSDSIELAYRYAVRGEKWGFQRTTVLRAYPFPEPPDARYVSEGLVWMAIARRYKTRFVNECLRIYRHDSTGDRMGALSASTVRGRLIFHEAILNDYRGVRFITLRARTRSAINYGRYSWLCGVPLRAQLRRLPALETRLLAASCAPAALLLSIRDRLRSRGGLGPRGAIRGSSEGRGGVQRPSTRSP
jgi:glycosyltransferase involved in cell wall biosynthesis